MDIESRTEWKRKVTAQQVKVLATMSDDRRLVCRTFMIEGEHQLWKLSSRGCCGKCVHTHKKNILKKKIEEELMASILSLLPDCTWSDQLVRVPAAMLPPPRWPVTSSCEPE